MKKVLKAFLILIMILTILACGVIVYFYSTTAGVKIDENKLVNLNRTTTYYDSTGEVISIESDGTMITEIDSIKEDTLNAFIAIEDKRFYNHKGIDYKRLVGATVNNIASFSFKEGASTISQQLIKNTHLSSKKTINRKLKEIKLAQKLEKKYSKKEILEKYLNTIYFGEGCYGITSAAKRFFNKTVDQLDVNESAVLAGSIKAPARYSPFINKDRCFNRKNLVLKCMLEQGYISQETFNNYKNEFPKLYQQEIEEKTYDYLYLVKSQLQKVNENSPYSDLTLDVHTNLNKNNQLVLEKALELVPDNYYKSAILINKKGEVISYYSTFGDNNRQLGSVIKPLLVYAPAIEEGVVNYYTHITDEKTDFNGYSPSNYNDKYYGKVTVKESLAKSLNTCSVKLLNYTGIDKAKSYLNNTDVKLTDEDNSLVLALGCSKCGSKLSEITSAYTLFLNQGNYKKTSTINKIVHNNKTIKDENMATSRVFSNETTSVMNEMLNYTAKHGTAKKLANLNGEFYAKTGTVGNENGNTDAYIISYSNEYVLGCWVGCKGDNLMPNSITGGSTCASVACEIWKEIYKNCSPEKIESSNNLDNVKIDKISYIEDGIIIPADDNAPERYVENILMDKRELPYSKSTRFSFPTIEKPILSVKHNEIEMRLCVPEYYKIDIYKNGKLITTVNNETSLIDKDILSNTKYTYKVIPYFENFDGKKFYGAEIILDTIKTPSTMLGDDWLD